VSWRRRGWRGFHFLQRVLPGAAHGGGLAFETRYGSRFLLDPLAYIDGLVLAEGYYESEVLEALRSSLRPGAVLWDIGANFGLHAVTAARLAPAATVVAFEPNPSEHARLLRHRAWNAPQLITSSIALSHAAGTLPLFLASEGNSGRTTLEAWFKPEASGQVLVAVSTGDQLIASGQLPAPTLIKLDVEGHEESVLRGLSAAIAHPRCELVVFEDHPQDDSAVKTILRAAGFTLAPLSRREKSDHPLANFAARKNPAA